MRRILSHCIVFLFLLLLTACKPQMIPFSDPALVEVLRRNGATSLALPGTMPEKYSYEGYRWWDGYTLCWTALWEGFEEYEITRTIYLSIKPGSLDVTFRANGFNLTPYTLKESGIDCYILEDAGDNTVQAVWLYGNARYHLYGQIPVADLYDILDALVIT